MVTQGSFCWYELMAADPDAAATFYGAVLGWRARDAGIPGVDYRMFEQGGRRHGGLMALPPDGPRPGWVGYVAVDDCDGAAEAARAAGAAIHIGPYSADGVGRFAIFSDPQGAMLAMIAPAPAELDRPAPVVAAWHELRTGDDEAAWSFYAALFGWEERDRMPMGADRFYRIFGVAGAERGCGGMMRDAQATPACWHFYFGVDGIDAALDRLRAAGGTLVAGPHEVPGGDRVAMCSDPEGIAFGLHSKER